MKKGPRKRCLVGPICRSLCDSKIKDLTISASMELNKDYEDVSLSDFIRQLQKEGMTIKKIEILNGKIDIEEERGRIDEKWTV